LAAWSAGSASAVGADPLLGVGEAAVVLDEVAAGADELVELARHEGDGELGVGGVDGGQGQLALDGVDVATRVGSTVGLGAGEGVHDRVRLLVDVGMAGGVVVGGHHKLLGRRRTRVAGCNAARAWAIPTAAAVFVRSSAR